MCVIRQMLAAKQSGRQGKSNRWQRRMGRTCAFSLGHCAKKDEQLHLSFWRSQRSDETLGSDRNARARIQLKDRTYVQKHMS